MSVMPKSKYRILEPKEGIGPLSRLRGEEKLKERHFPRIGCFDLVNVFGDFPLS